MASTTTPTSTKNRSCCCLTVPRYSFPERYKEAYYNEIDHFVDLILGVVDTPRLSATDVAHVTVMLDAAAESAKTGQIVQIKYD